MMNCKKKLGQQLNQGWQRDDKKTSSENNNSQYPEFWGICLKILLLKNTMLF